MIKLENVTVNPMMGQYYYSASELCRRWDISQRTFERWLDDAELDFPRPLYVKGNRYFNMDEVEAWESSLPRQPDTTRRAKPRRRVRT